MSKSKIKQNVCTFEKVYDSAFDPDNTERLSLYLYNTPVFLLRNGVTMY